MRLVATFNAPFFCLVLNFFISFAQAQSQKGVAGTINNAVQASVLQGAATLLTPGSYTLTNVATGQALTYQARFVPLCPVYLLLKFYCRTA